MRLVLILYMLIELFSILVSYLQKDKHHI